MHKTSNKGSGFSSVSFLFNRIGSILVNAQNAAGIRTRTTFVLRFCRAAVVLRSDSDPGEQIDKYIRCARAFANSSILTGAIRCSPYHHSSICQPQARCSRPQHNSEDHPTEQSWVAQRISDRKSYTMSMLLQWWKQRTNRFVQQWLVCPLVSYFHCYRAIVAMQFDAMVTIHHEYLLVLRYRDAVLPNVIHRIWHPSPRRLITKYHHCISFRFLSRIWMCLTHLHSNFSDIHAEQASPMKRTTHKCSHKH